MTATTAVLPVHDIMSELAAELHEYGPSGVVNGATVASCFRNIVCLEHRTRMAELPEPLYAVFAEVENKPQNVYDVVELTARIARIGNELK